MKEPFVQFRNASIKFGYKQILRKIYFLFDPEVIHDRMVDAGIILGKFSITKGLTSIFFNYKNKKLKQNILGLNFSNPVGLGAGFDKDAHLLDILPEVGFGFVEIGSITGEACDGNPKPRLWRLKKEKSLRVNYGLKSEGCEKVARRFRSKRSKVPVAVSIARTNNKDTIELSKGIEDYFKSYRCFRKYGDLLIINISCPNAYGGGTFGEPDKLNQLLQRLKEAKVSKPVFLKLSPDLDKKNIDFIIEIAKEYGVDGFVCTNLAKKVDIDLPGKGGVSGKLLGQKAHDMVKYVYYKTKGEFVIIGCGGISSAEDAYGMIKSGASLVQLITGMIYEGPQVVSEINQGLIELLEKDGFNSVSEAVGVDNNFYKE